MLKRGIFNRTQHLWSLWNTSFSRASTEGYIKRNEIKNQCIDKATQFRLFKRIFMMSFSLKQLDIECKTSF